MYFPVIYRVAENKVYIVEQMEELKYESEDLYADEGPSTVNSTQADR